MKNILTLIHDDHGLESRLRAALDLTRVLDGQLICLDLTVPPVMFGTEPLYGTIVLEPEVRGEVQAAARQKVEQSGIPYHWVERQGDLQRELGELAGLADMVVLSAPKEPAQIDMRGAVGAMLVKSGKRVVAVPSSAAGMDISGPALLLWDGSPAAHNALYAAVPLFRLAKTVTILEVDDGSLGVSAIRASDHLSDQRIPNTMVTVDAARKGTAAAILYEISHLQPAYVAMGGYGHSRLIEGLFGGVTERLLKECPVPLFLKN